MSTVFTMYFSKSNDDNRRNLVGEDKTLFLKVKGNYYRTEVRVVGAYSGASLFEAAHRVILNNSDDKLVYESAVCIDQNCVTPLTQAEVTKLNLTFGGQKFTLERN